MGTGRRRDGTGRYRPYVGGGDGRESGAAAELDRRRRRRLLGITGPMCGSYAGPPGGPRQEPRSRRAVAASVFEPVHVAEVCVVREDRVSHLPPLHPASGCEVTPPQDPGGSKGERERPEEDRSGL